MTRTESFNPVSQEAVEITNNLQHQCAGAVLSILNDLRIGMSEVEIAKILKGELETRGVNDYWYDVPILVLVGPNRFRDMEQKDYAKKEPSEDVIVKPNDAIFIDIHPRDRKSGRWGNFARTIIKQPEDEEQVKFLEEMVVIHRKGISALKPDMNVSDLVGIFDNEFSKNGATLLDVRNCYGHNMGNGSKTSFQRVFLEADSKVPIKGQIWGIEPSGIKDGTRNQLLVARIEDCVHISRSGVKLLGGQDAAKSQVIFSVK